MENLDRADARENPNILRGLPQQQNPADEATLDRMTKRGALMERLHDILPKYYEILLLDKEMRGLSRISRVEHEDFFDQTELDNTLDKPARGFFYDADDFITTRTDRVHESLEWLVYGDNWLYEFLRKTLVLKKSSDGTEYVSKDRLRKISIAVIVFLTLGLLLCPMLILFLAPLEKWLSAVVVGFFGLVSATGMSSLKRVKSDTVFIAMSAYMAVLVTFLANLQGGQCQCG